MKTEEIGKSKIQVSMKVGYELPKKFFGTLTQTLTPHGWNAMYTDISYTIQLTEKIVESPGIIV